MKLLCILIFSALCQFVEAQAMDFERLADAIKREENSVHFAYGVEAEMDGEHYGFPEITARKMCIGICRREFARWQRAGSRGDFIEFLSKVYCPKNSKSWAKNVKSIYNS